MVAKFGVEPMGIIGSAPVPSEPPGHFPRTALMDGHHGLGLFLAEPPPDIEQAFSDMRRILTAYRNYARANDVKVVFVIFPQKFQVQSRDWNGMISFHDLKDNAFDLMAPNTRIAAYCRNIDLTCVDLTTPLCEYHERTGEPLYLGYGDMHWNAGGHGAVADLLQPRLEALLGTEPATRRSD